MARKQHRQKEKSADPQEDTINPATEPDNDRAVVASKWELLRRNSTFGDLARQWISSDSFRQEHALTPDYKRDDAARCALDWMLTSTRRLKLARFQIRNLSFMRDPRFKFGPLMADWLVKRGTYLHDLAAHHRLFRIRNANHSRTIFNGFLTLIQTDLCNHGGRIVSVRKRHEGWDLDGQTGALVCRVPLARALNW